MDSTQKNVEVGKLLVDSGATPQIINDMSIFHMFDNGFKSDKHFIEMANGEKSKNDVFCLKGWHEVQSYCNLEHRRQTK